MGAPGPLIKNANVPRRAFDVGPGHTKPAKVTKGPCNPLFGAPMQRDTQLRALTVTINHVRAASHKSADPLQHALL